MPRRIVPHDAELSARISSRQFSQRLDDRLSVLPHERDEMVCVRVEIERAKVALPLLRAINLEDSLLSLLEPRSPELRLPHNTRLVSGEQFVVFQSGD